MDNIKILEEIGLSKVSKETHIEQKYLKYMIDMKYDKLNHINTRGFVKILSREYKIDLDAWSEAFEEYWIENRKEDEEDGLFIVVDDEKKSKKLLIVVLIIILGAIFSTSFSFFQDKIDIANYINNEETNYEQTIDVKEVQNALLEENNSLEKVVIEEPLSEDINSTEEVLMEDNKTDRNVAVNIDKNITTQAIEKSIEDNSTIKTDEVINKNIAEQQDTKKFETEAVLIPKLPLWIGVIYLDNNKRRSYLGEGNFSIDLSRDQIITTGHGSFDIKIGDETKEFRKQAPIRFLVKDSNMTEISLNKFKELNKGKPW